jgi:hypothetical protein
MAIFYAYESRHQEHLPPYAASTVGDLWGLSIYNRYHLISHDILADIAEVSLHQAFGEHLALPNDTTETPRSTAANRQVAGSNAARGS